MSENAGTEVERPPTGRSPTRMALTIFKSIGTLAACLWILSLVDWQQFWGAISSASFAALIVVLLLRSLGILLSAYKWQILLLLNGASFRLAMLVRWYLVATFMNYFLPTSIGGDAYRVYRTLDNDRSRSCAVLAVFMERVTGFLALLVLGMVAALSLGGRVLTDPIVSGLLLVCVAGIVMSALAALIWPRLLSLVPFELPAKWSQRIAALRELVDDYGLQRRLLVLVGGVSFLFHVNRIAVTWLVLFAVGATLDPVLVTLIVVAIETVGLLPISLGGIGVVDGSFVYLAGRFGVAAAPALAAMLTLRILNLPFSLAGAILYALGDPKAGRLRRHPLALSVESGIPHTSESRI